VNWRTARLWGFSTGPSLVAALVGMAMMTGSASIARPVSPLPTSSSSLEEGFKPFAWSRDARLVGWLSAEEGLLILTRLDAYRQFHRVEMAGGMRRQLSFYEGSVAEADVVASAGRAAAAFTMESDPSRLLLFDLRTGATRSLLQEDGRLDSPRFSHNGKRLAVGWVSPDASQARLVLLEPFAEAEAKTVLEGPGRWVPLDWSADDRRLLALHHVAPGEDELWLIDVSSGTGRRLLEETGPAELGPACFGGKGKGIVFVSDQWRGICELATLDLDSGEVLRRSNSIRWDVEELALSPDGKLLAFSVNENGASRLYLLRMDRTSTPHSVDLPTGVVGRLAFQPLRGGAYRLALELTTPISPWDIYVLEGVQGRPRLVRWTESEVGGLDPERFVRPSLIHYRTFDRGPSGGTREIAVLYYRPLGAGAHPVVIDLGRASSSQNRLGFDPRLQFWVTRLGLAVLTPNLRGSTGYGREFAHLADGEHEGDVIRDLLALVDWVEERPELDASRIGIFGEGRAVKVVLSALATSGGRLGAGAVIAGAGGLGNGWEGIETPLLIVQDPKSASPSGEAAGGVMEGTAGGRISWFTSDGQGDQGRRSQVARLEARLAEFWLTQLIRRSTP